MNEEVKKAEKNEDYEKGYIDGTLDALKMLENTLDRTTAIYTAMNNIRRSRNEQRRF